MGVALATAWAGWAGAGLGAGAEAAQLIPVPGRFPSFSRGGRSASLRLLVLLDSVSALPRLPLRPEAALSGLWSSQCQARRRGAPGRAGALYLRV